MTTKQNTESNKNKAVKISVYLVSNKYIAQISTNKELYDSCTKKEI